MFNEQELEAMANEFLKEKFNMSLEVPVKLNGRLTRALGRFKYAACRDGRKVSLVIEVAKRLNTYSPKEDIIDTLYHECIHYALLEKGIPNRDSDITFIETCNSLGVSLSGTKLSYEPKHHYTCPSCSKKFESKKFIKNPYCPTCEVKCTYKGKITLREPNKRC